MITHRVFAGFRGRPGHEHDPGLVGSDKVRVIRVLFKPIGSLLVPVGDLGSEPVGFIRVGFRVFLFVVKEEFIDVEGVIVVGVVMAGRRRMEELFEHAVGLGELARGVVVEVFADLDEVLLRSPESSGSDRATKDDDGEHQAEDCDLAVAESSLDLSRSLGSQTLVYHCFLKLP